MEVWEWKYENMESCREDSAIGQEMKQGPESHMCMYTFHILSVFICRLSYHFWELNYISRLRVNIHKG